MTGKKATPLHFVLVISGLSLLIALAVSMSGIGGSWAHRILAGKLLLYVALPLGISVIAIAVLGSIRRRKTYRKVGVYASIWLLQVLILLASYPAGTWRLNSEIDQAMRYCAELADRLDRYQEKEGKYPASLECMNVQDEDLPELLRGIQFYFRTAHAYALTFPNPKVFGGYITYLKGTNTWYAY